MLPGTQNIKINRRQSNFFNTLHHLPCLYVKTTYACIRVHLVWEASQSEAKQQAAIPAVGSWSNVE